MVRYPVMTVDGAAYVTKSADHNDTSVLFILWRGKGANMWGYLYNDLSPPLKPGAEIMLKMNVMGNVAYEPVVVDKEIKPQWYTVFSDQD